MSVSLRIASARDVDPEILADFLGRSFGVVKGKFLERHGTWWHRGDENRWVLMDGEGIAGYTGVIPTVCHVGGEARHALWWMDLVIDPQYRGRGLQSQFDELVQSKNTLLLGFPNALAAKIHRHHGWGVREDLRTLLLPLDPSRMPRLQRSQGWPGASLRSVAAVVRPAAALWRGWLRRCGRPRSGLAGTARRIEPDVHQLEAIALENLVDNLVTTRRDAEYLQWRYLAAPYRQQLRFYAAGNGSRPEVVLVTRRLNNGAERWLDLFGAHQDADLVERLARRAVGEAVDGGVSQITALSADPRLHKMLRRAGFLVSAVSRMCWLDRHRETMGQIAALPHHWCLGDSDGDEPADVA